LNLTDGTAKTEENPFAQSSVQERHISDVAPTELVIFCGWIFYKDVAPLALEGSAGFSPLQRAIDDDVWVS